MTPTLIEEDGPSRFERLIKTNPKLELCVYFCVRPATPNSNELHTIHFVKFCYMGLKSERPMQDHCNFATSRFVFLGELLENYKDAFQNLYHCTDIPSHEDRIPFICIII